MIDISIVIPTYNRLSQLKKLIKALETQNYPPDRYEVIVISDGSTDGTNEYLSSLSTCLNLRSIVQENAGVAVARNTGAQSAQADLILFLDDDILPDENLIRNHVKSHSEIGLSGIIIGPMLTPQDWKLSPWVAWEQSQLEKQYRSMLSGIYQATSRQFYTGNASLKKDFFFTNGRFDPQFRRAEDVEFAYRAEKLGAEFIFNPEAKGYHYAQRSFESWVRIAYSYGKNDVMFTYDKGVDWLLPRVLEEYKKRNILMRFTLPFFLDHINIQKHFINFLKFIGTAFYRRYLYKISHVALSGVFNLSYYQGISDQLGGREKFFSLLSQRSSGPAAL